ncbi:MAG: N-carbamoylputrescine amidase, partial [Gammaproteobacteria bacterium]|nr:N-carbamoylputrescine amidase [Gammaproteobacteria bacterium]
VSHVQSRDHWQRTMQGHAAANMAPLVASNRIGQEAGETCSIDFYGSSFIADQTGAKVAEASEDREEVLLHSFDLESIAELRTGWGLFRDRRPEHYGPLVTLSGKAP